MTFHCLLLGIYILGCVRAEKQPLYVGGLFELTESWYAKYANFFITIIEHVFEDVDNRTDILADYSLKLIPKDTEGKGGLATRRMVELMTDGTPKVAIVGPAMSAEMTVVGQITPFYDVLQLSYVASTSSTVDRGLFKTLFKVNQIVDDLNPLRIKMMQYFNWSRVGTIFSQGDIYVSEMTSFHDLLKQHNMSLVTSAVISDGADIKELIKRLAQYDVRIIMGSFRGTMAPAIFCEAYKQGLYGRNHVWILSGPPLYDNWVNRYSIDGLGCTREELVVATFGCFSLNYAKLNINEEISVSGKTPMEVKSYLEKKVAKTSFKLSSSFGWLHDCAWALAIGLNNSLQYLGDSGFSNFTNDQYFLEAVLKGMQEVNFLGISGPIAFDSKGSRVGLTYIEQHFNSTRTNIAEYSPFTENLTWLVPVKSLWAGGSIPRDRFTYKRVMVQPSIPSLVLILLANCICCLTALGFLGFNIHYRTNSNIKLSSPMINNLIIVGSILLYTGVFLAACDYGYLTSDALDSCICMVRVWIMSLGFTLLFGALFSKTWRVHILFRDYKLKKTSIRDYHLFGLVFVLLMIDCVILLSWSATHALQKTSVARSIKDPEDYNSVISEVYTYCFNPNGVYWFLSLYIYKGILLVFGTFLAWETKHVTVPALNDSKYIGFCIYNVVIVCVFGVPLSHVLPTGQTTLNFVLLSSLVMFCTTMCLCILFLPKLKFRNKVSERFLVPSLNTLVSQPSRSDTKDHSAKVTSFAEDSIQNVSKEGKDQTEEMKAENRRLRMQIASDSIALAGLKRDILKVTGNVQFYRIGNQYVVFRSKTARKSSLDDGTVIAGPDKEA